MADVVAVLLSGVLGAVVLAGALLHKAHQRDRARITQLSAELAAQKIAALTFGGPPTLLPQEEPEPVRRKKHLGLYIGGGVAAFLASTGEQIRHAWHGHRTATTATVTVAAASVAAVGAFALTSSDGQPPAAVVPSSSGLGKPDPEAGGDAADNDASDIELADEGPRRDAELLDVNNLSVVPSPLLAPTPRATGTAPTLRVGTEQQAGQDAGTPAETPAPGESPSASAPGTQAPTPAPETPDQQATPTPSPSPTVPQQTPPQCTIGVALPPLLDLCLAK
ncbi:hypothetical protein OG322_26130 [Streptomyces sp. NBC_01260]|uniref:hypothetical protein n=1 Tax=Streptomyces sp. NBC_01260 TaxID=2903801 RepID=UPI002E32CDD5|nr:hypothetical protein [Streptomyces sp. NBC_01260]